MDEIDYDEEEKSLNNSPKKDDDKRKPGEPRCKGRHCKEIEDLINFTVLTLDSISWTVSIAEAAVSDAGYGLAAVACVGTEGVGCGPAFAAAFEFDVAVASWAGTVENNAGWLSTALTATNDWLSGNTGYDNGIGVYIGKDTVVSFRNSLAGMIPESNIDALVSSSQIKYDLDRLRYNGIEAAGGKPGGFVPLFSLEFLSQLLVKDWW